MTQILVPSCSSGEFCYGNGQCEAACNILPDQTQCTSSTLYYPPTRSCYGEASSKSYDSFSSFYQRGGHTTTIATAGYLYVNLADEGKVPIKVYPGDVLGFRTSSGAQVANRNATAEEIVNGRGDKSAPAIDRPWTNTTYAHFARAIVSYPATAVIEMSYSLVGNYTFTATCVDPVTGSTATNLSTIMVAVGIGGTYDLEISFPLTKRPYLIVN